MAKKPQSISHAFLTKSVPANPAHAASYRTAMCASTRVYASLLEAWLFKVLVLIEIG